MSRLLRVKAVIAYSTDGSFIIHGSNDETPQQMAKAIQPLWELNPQNETIKYVEFDVEVPDETNAVVIG